MPVNFQDKVEIQELVARYASSFDNGNSDDWLDVWADDGVWDGPLGVYTGKLELTKLITDLGGNLQDKRRVMTNIVISESGDQAKVECYMLILERKISTAILATSVFSGIFKKVEDRWKLAHSSVRMDPSCAAMREQATSKS